MIKVRLFMIVLKTIHALVHVCIPPIATTLRVVHQERILDLWIWVCSF